MTHSPKRQHVSILAADVASYTALMEEAEEAVHARTQQLRDAVIAPALEARNGRIVKNTGDGFLAVFESTTDAMECALQIQQDVARAAGAPEVPPVLFRMGINRAEVIVESYDVFGEGVNLAARLQGMAEPGGIVLSEDAARDIRGSIGIDLVDLGLLSLKNIRRPVRAYAVGSGVPAPVLHALPRAERDDRPWIIVLPFRLADEDPGFAWFAEGIIEGIIHVLSGIENLFVIARGTSLAYLGQSPSPARLKHDLGVRYILSGSVHRDGTRLRIVTELADAESVLVIRSDRHDGEVADLFAMQDQIANQVVATIAPAVRERELSRARRKHPDSLTAYDLLLQALSLIYGLEREPFERARGLLQQAIAHDPGFAPAYSHAATWHNFRIGQGWTPNIHEDAAEAARLARAAIERDRNDATALAIHGQVLSFTRRDYAAAEYFLAQAREFGPSCHMAWTLSSATSGWTGNGVQAVEQAMHALQLSPMDPFAFFAEHMLSQGYYVAGDFENAVLWGQRSARRNGLLTSNLRTLAASLVAAGDMEAARAVARRVLALEPAFTLSAFAARSPIHSDVMASHIPRLRLAGLPD